MSLETLDSARKIAHRFLESAARTQAEIERRLERAGYTEEIIAQVISEIEARGWLNDAEFAQRWVEDRADRKQYGKTRLAMELQRKGVASETIAESLSEVSQDDELARALGAINRKTDAETFQSLSRDELQAEKRRLSGFLLRRGFSWGVIKQVFATLALNDEED